MHCSYKTPSGIKPQPHQVAPACIVLYCKYCCSYHLLFPFLNGWLFFFYCPEHIFMYAYLNSYVQILLQSVVVVTIKTVPPLLRKALGASLHITHPSKEYWSVFMAKGYHLHHEYFPGKDIIVSSFHSKHINLKLVWFKIFCLMPVIST